MRRKCLCRPLLNLIVLTWVPLACLPVTLSGAEILFMHEPVNLDFDEPLAEFMESLGHSVTFFVTSGTVAEDQIEAAADADIIYVAESLGSGSVHDGLETFIKDVETPQIWAEAYAWDEAAMTGDIQFEDFGNTQRANIDEDPEEEFNEGQEGFFIQDGSHPLAGGFSDFVQVYEDPYSLNWGLTDTLGPGATVVGSVDEAGTYATLFVYDKGAILEDDTPAADIRIALWLGQAGLGAPFFDNLTDDGLTMIEAALNYGLGLTQRGDPGDFNQNGELDTEDIDLLSAAIRDAQSDAIFDLNEDGMVDASDRLHWINVLANSFVGDSNLDGEFSSSDFVTVFVPGKYETGEMAGYAEGDWNGDMLFNSGDFVAAFTQGAYEKGPRPAAVPEPASSAMLLVAGLAALTMRRRHPVPATLR